MSENKKRSTPDVVGLAARTLASDNASKIAKKLAASALAQGDPAKQTGPTMEDVASRVMRSPNYSEDTKTLAGSVLSQANKER